MESPNKCYSCLYIWYLQSLTTAVSPTATLYSDSISISNIIQKRVSLMGHPLKLLEYFFSVSFCGAGVWQLYAVRRVVLW